jgi:hypothetical protein
MLCLSVVGVYQCALRASALCFCGCECRSLHVCFSVRGCVYVCVRLCLLVTVYACAAVIFFRFTSCRAHVCSYTICPISSVSVSVCVCVGGGVLLVCVYDESCSVCCINQFLICSACSVPLSCAFLLLGVYRCVIILSVCVRVRARVRVCVWLASLQFL